MTCCNVIMPNNKISLCILPMAECSGESQTFWYFGYFLTVWAFLSKQFTQNYIIRIQWRKIISIDFHHVPKLSIGFNHNHWGIINGEDRETTTSYNFPDIRSYLMTSSTTLLTFFCKYCMNYGRRNC